MPSILMPPYAFSGLISALGFFCLMGMGCYLVSRLLRLNHGNNVIPSKLGVKNMMAHHSRLPEAICMEILEILPVNPTISSKPTFTDLWLTECKWAQPLGWCRGLLLLGVDSSHYKLLLWNLWTDERKEIPDPPYQLEYDYICASTLGYDFHIRSHKIVRDVTHRAIEYFDFAVNNFLVVPQSGDYDNRYFHITPQFYDTEGSLCIEYRENDGLILEIWVMKRYGVKDSWFKWMSFEDDYIPFPICFAKNNINVSFVVGRGERCSAIYNGKEKGIQLTCFETLAGWGSRGSFEPCEGLKKSAFAVDESLICFEHEEVGER
ncbi:F-box protein [Corchorus olitorius]|uniref:F-box protein n=1 Tax=Corchorus olitorius TaxID=93759 RepID=A0A1R3HGH7_9ROSI|nr:F-box protein [Corchorus olitorius]